MKRLLLIVGIIVLDGYVTGYVLFRNANIQIWAKDNHTYVVFPKEERWLYYFLRPCTYVDAALTGMRFHIGPHQELSPSSAQQVVPAGVDRQKTGG